MVAAPGPNITDHASPLLCAGATVHGAPRAAASVRGGIHRIVDLSPPRARPGDA